MAYRVGCISLGCEKNRVDAEMMMASLEREGFQLVDDVAMGDAAIVNTCVFIESAKQESIEEILELAEAEGGPHQSDRGHRMPGGALPAGNCQRNCRKSTQW